jgi:hypothetical protein
MENIEAWLEKQKYDRIKPVYDARESFESALEKAWNDYHNGYENVDKFEDDYVECAHAKGFREGYLFGIEKQKEPTTEELYAEAGTTEKEYIANTMKMVRAMRETKKEQKPAEWSEEDEKMRNLAIEWAETMSGQISFVDMGSTDFRKIVAWLKSLRPSWKPSKEQMDVLERLISRYRYCWDENTRKLMEFLYEQLQKL